MFEGKKPVYILRAGFFAGEIYTVDPVSQQLIFSPEIDCCSIVQ